jgi:arginyl-tRNA synthetase
LFVLPLIEPLAAKQHLVIDYSHPNIAKPLGIHHVLSTVIGQAIANLNRAVGHQVTAWNYLGDWGTQFGKLIYAYKTWGDQSVIEKDPINELLKLYVKFHQLAETSPELEDFGREEFRKLEAGDSQNRQLWTWIVELSKSDFSKVYAKLGGISFDLFSGEADREAELPAIIKDGMSQGIFEVGEEGAIIANLEAESLPPFLVQKKDGATLYSTRDIASVKVRAVDHDGDKLIYVVDSSQSLHFQQLFATVKKFDWMPPNTELLHVKFGRMNFKDSKMSTRKGNIIHLEALIDEAIERAAKIVEEKNPTLENKEEVARIIGIGSLKYSFLSQAPETDILFDWDKILSFEGNSAPYLQYSYARANSILKQIDQDSIPENFNLEDLASVQTDELAVLKKLVQFSEIVATSATKSKPNLLANYLFELAKLFNSFYVNFPVLSCPETDLKNFRVALVIRFLHTMKTGLNLLAGIEVPDKM